MHLNKSSIEDRGWASMEKILDKEMPQKKKRRFFIWWLVGLFFISTTGVYFAYSQFFKSNPIINNEKLLTDHHEPTKNNATADLNIVKISTDNELDSVGEKGEILSPIEKKTDIIISNDSDIAEENNAINVNNRTVPKAATSNTVNVANSTVPHAATSNEIKVDNNATAIDKANHAINAGNNEVPVAETIVPSIVSEERKINNINSGNLSNSQEPVKSIPVDVADKSDKPNVRDQIQLIDEPEESERPSLTKPNTSNISEAPSLHNLDITNTKPQIQQAQSQQSTSEENNMQSVDSPFEDSTKGNVILEESPKDGEGIAAVEALLVNIRALPNTINQLDVIPSEFNKTPVMVYLAPTLKFKPSNEIRVGLFMGYQYKEKTFSAELTSSYLRQLSPHWSIGIGLGSGIYNYSNSNESPALTDANSNRSPEADQASDLPEGPAGPQGPIGAAPPGGGAGGAAGPEEMFGEPTANVFEVSEELRQQLSQESFRSSLYVNAEAIVVFQPSKRIELSGSLGIDYLYRHNFEDIFLVDKSFLSFDMSEANAEPVNLSVPVSWVPASQFFVSYAINRRFKMTAGAKYFYKKLFPENGPDLNQFKMGMQMLIPMRSK